MTQALEMALKTRVQKHAREQGLSPEFLWQVLVIERLLPRFARSRFSKYFVLKGGILLANYCALGRETRDIDFHVRNLSNDVSSLTSIVEEIATIDLEDHFAYSTIGGSRLNHPHMSYTGARMKMDARFGKGLFNLRTQGFSIQNL